MSQDEEGAAGEPCDGLGTDLTSRNVAVGAIVLARYLRSRDRSFARFLDAALENARSSGLTPSDLAFLELLARICH